MPPKSKRLSAAEVRNVLKNGKFLRCGGVSARYITHINDKAAVVVSRRVVKKATERNRLRRMGYRSLALRPNTHLVLFINRADATQHDVTGLCSKLF